MGHTTILHLPEMRSVSKSEKIFSWIPLSHPWFLLLHLVFSQTLSSFHSRII
jgi:hypothetical protein